MNLSTIYIGDPVSSFATHGLDDRFHETHHIGGDVKVL
jgi:hypothetical protein